MWRFLKEFSSILDDLRKRKNNDTSNTPLCRMIIRNVMIVNNTTRRESGSFNNNIWAGYKWLARWGEPEAAEGQQLCSVFPDEPQDEMRLFMVAVHKMVASIHEGTLRGLKSSPLLINSEEPRGKKTGHVICLDCRTALCRRMLTIEAQPHSLLLLLLLLILLQDITDEFKQRIADEMSFSETAFVSKKKPEENILSGKFAFLAFSSLPLFVVCH